jgi:hypothetical protein
MPATPVDALTSTCAVWGWLAVVVAAFVWVPHLTTRRARRDAESWARREGVELVHVSATWFNVLSNWHTFRLPVEVRRGRLHREGVLQFRFWFSLPFGSWSGLEKVAWDGPWFDPQDTDGQIADDD